VVTELEDPTLRDPAISFRNFQEPGAARWQVTPSWGYEGDGQEGDFYRVYQVVDGVLVTNQAPPTVDTFAQTLARYDRQSTGGFYVAYGLMVTRLADDQGQQVFSVADGAARVNGQEIVKQYAARLVYDATPDTRSVLLEPHLVTTSTGEDFSITLNHAPVYAISDVAQVRVVTESRTHGLLGARDPLTKTPVTAISAVTQTVDGTPVTYEQGADYKLTADAVDWSLAGNEPAPGSTYQVTYQYQDTETAPEEVTETSLVVPGSVLVTVFNNESAAAELVGGSVVQVNYQWAMPRYDLICLDQDGQLITVPGVAAPYYPRVPNVPKGLLNLAIIEQRWGPSTQIINNGTRMVPMNELRAVNNRIDTLFALIAEERLALNLTQRDASAKKGVFADPFFDDDLRDQGLVQTAAIFAGELTLGVEASVHMQSLAAPVTLDARVTVEQNIVVGPEELAIGQVWRTGTMKINPYDSFAPMPGIAVLTPAVDFWTEIETNWLSPIARQFNEDIFLNPDIERAFANGAMIWRSIVSNEEFQQTEVEKVGSKYVELQNLRPIVVKFELAGFGPGEVLNQVWFDNQAVEFTEVI
jgi:hypothetical protein